METVSVSVMFIELLKISGNVSEPSLLLVEHLTGGQHTCTVHAFILLVILHIL